MNRSQVIGDIVVMATGDSERDSKYQKLTYERFREVMASTLEEMRKSKEFEYKCEGVVPILNAIKQCMVEAVSTIISQAEIKDWNGSPLYNDLHDICQRHLDLATKHLHNNN